MCLKRPCGAYPSSDQHGGPPDDTTQPHNGHCQTITAYENGTRIIVAAHTATGTHLSDIAADGISGYVTEPHLDSQTEVDALVADYLAKAAEIGCAPMLPGCRGSD